MDTTAKSINSEEPDGCFGDNAVTLINLEEESQQLEKPLYVYG